MQISARNQIKGKIKSVRAGSIMAEVEVSVAPSQLTAVITKSSAERLGLKKGQTVTVIVKSTELMIAR
ncbi:MAG: TOBE domain-containing protein [Candidatus Eremiobacteraeota bacterium]|nr:TOBE domain-containing protein [Candidatus Eremiobacteraeota bacterium]MBV8262477.1 TOBE domain-containing protein [Candidatus Eremiobacteraeota bacterium]MBV8339214.1 TOBE domain-containing protein [Candidatus Eremiobacteraeota bacterium]MBV8461634.1 TOBE domain-containing protein [Candidatus Eremiobacteraeota bacterium]MBV8596457.1 TOBE domain-containing protein [Candidatus Eremiobacteraeota bacterium]